MSGSTDITHRRVDDWCTLLGANVEIRQQGNVISSGIVDTVTEDGHILWVHSSTHGRKLFEKADFYQAWAAEERIGFHYQVSCSQN
jgi:biotin-(acetyl-CoA carboxylase) ligase